MGDKERGRESHICVHSDVPTKEERKALVPIVFWGNPMLTAFSFFLSLGIPFFSFICAQSTHENRSVCVTRSITRDWPNSIFIYLLRRRQLQIALALPDMLRPAGPALASRQLWWNSLEPIPRTPPPPQPTRTRQLSFWILHKQWVEFVFLTSTPSAGSTVWFRADSPISFFYLFFPLRL